MLRYISFAAACFIGTEAIQLSSYEESGEFKTAADGTAQIDWVIGLEKNQLRERMITRLGIEADSYDKYVNENGYGFLLSPDWGWEFIIDGPRPEYVINGSNLKAPEDDIAIMSKTIPDRLEFV